MVRPSGKEGWRETQVRFRFGSPFSSKVVYGHLSAEFAQDVPGALAFASTFCAQLLLPLLFHIDCARYPLKTLVTTVNDCYQRSQLSTYIDIDSGCLTEEKEES